jgi:hypothetical protein
MGIKGEAMGAAAELDDGVGTIDEEEILELEEDTGITGAAELDAVELDAIELDELEDRTGEELELATALGVGTIGTVVTTVDVTTETAGDEEAAADEEAARDEEAAGEEAAGDEETTGGESEGVLMLDEDGEGTGLEQEVVVMVLTRV